MEGNTESERQHPVFDRFEAAGYRREDLVDPANVTPEDIESGGWRVVVFDNHGVTAYDVDESAVRHPDWAPAGLAVEHGYSGGTTQPIGFADETGLLNDPLPDMERFSAGASEKAIFFWPAEAEREFPKFSETEAVEALGYWHSEGFVPRRTAMTITEPFDVDLEASLFRDDPDVEGGEIIRAPTLAKRVAAANLARSKSADPGISGHKKTRRQKFYRNMEALREALGIEDE